MRKIAHRFYFYHNGFKLSWDVKLPYRAITGDLICMDFFQMEGKIKDKKTADEWFNFSLKYEVLEVDYIVLHSDEEIGVHLKLGRFSKDKKQ